MNLFYTYLKNKIFACSNKQKLTSMTVLDYWILDPDKVLIQYPRWAIFCFIALSMPAVSHGPSDKFYSFFHRVMNTYFKVATIACEWIEHIHKYCFTLKTDFKKFLKIQEAKIMPKPEYRQFIKSV
jgi:hypothetical protein